MTSKTFKIKSIRKRKKRPNKANLRADRKRLARNSEILSKMWSKRKPYASPYATQTLAAAGNEKCGIVTIFRTLFWVGSGSNLEMSVEPQQHIEIMSKTIIFCVELAGRPLNYKFRGYWRRVLANGQGKWLESTLDPWCKEGEGKGSIYLD